MWPETRGLPSSTIVSRIFDHIPSQPIERTSFDGFTIIERHADVVTVILEAIDAPAGFERDQVTALAGLQEYAMNVGAMGNAVRLAKALHELGVERHIGNEITGQRIAHFLRRRPMCVSQYGIFEPNFLEDAENVRPELDAGTDFTEFR